MTFPRSRDLTIHFAHPAYRLKERFDLRDTGIAGFQTWNMEDTVARLGEADVMVISGLWRDAFLERTRRLRLIQVSAVGYDQFGLDALKARGISLTNGAGINKNAVSEHAMALLLAFTRQIHIARDNQLKHNWRGMISDLSRREDELPGKTLLIYGLGAIGQRIARLASAFGMTVIGIRRNTAVKPDGVDEVHGPDAFLSLLPRADAVVLSCPLTPETRHLIDAGALAAMKPTSILVNVARGPCVDEAALVAALKAGRIGGAAIDTTDPEPLPPASPLWAFENVILTSHTAGETRKYEDNVVDILLENLKRLDAGETALLNQIV